MQRIVEILKSIRIKYIIIICLFLIFSYWGIKAFERYWSQPLTTDISYKFGDGNGNGIQFPIVTFCQLKFEVTNPLLKACNNGSWEFFPSFVNCLKTDENFDIDSFMDSFQTERKMVIDEARLWTGSFHIDLKDNDQHLWSRVFDYGFGLCYSFDLSNINEYEFVPYNERSRPGISFTPSENNPWSQIAIILHSKYDFPDALVMNGKNGISMSNEKLVHTIEIRKKIIKRVSTRKSPCAEFEYNTCKNIEENKLVLDQFNCQIPILYFGHHLDHLIPREIPICDRNVTKKAFDLLWNKKTECIRSQTCDKKRYTTTHKIKKIGENRKSTVFVAFENPEVEYHNTYISYGLLSLIGEVGGTLGLTLGASIMTLFDSIFQRLSYY